MTTIAQAWAARNASKRHRPALIAANGTRCHYCGTETTPSAGRLNTSMRVDHVVPTEHGGSNDPSNLVIACNACNTNKRTSDVLEWSVRRTCAGFSDFGHRMAMACVDRWRSGQ